LTKRVHGSSVPSSYSPGVSAVTLRELTDENRDAVLALHVAPGQERFVGTVAGALMDAREIPEGNPWYRAIYADDQPVGFVMLSWNVTPEPPRIIGPWFLWKLLVDERHQRRGYGREAVRLVADIVRGNGAAELLTSCVPGDGGPEPFYRRIGFSPTGELDENGEIILALGLGA
jgi:diamine N-acetyltransferase